MGIVFWVMTMLCVVSMILAWTMVVAEKNEKHFLTYMAKTLASVCFVAAGVIAVWLSKGTEGIVLLILLGLIFGMLGDIFLCRKHIAKEEYWAPLLTAGGSFFLIGHLCYFAAFVLMGGMNNLWLYIIVPVLVVVIFVMMKKGVWKIQKKDWFNYLGYALVSGLMVSGGIGVLIADPIPKLFVLCIAAMVFIFSDLTLATWNYGKLHTTWMRFICISAYYAAQIIFVYGIWMN